MANFAIISNGAVDNVIVADNLSNAQAAVSPFATVVEDTDFKVGVGWRYDGTNFVEPVYAAPAAQETQGA